MEEAIRSAKIDIHDYRHEFGEEVWMLDSEEVGLLGQQLRREQHSDLDVPEEFHLGMQRRLYNHTLKAARLRAGFLQKELGALVGVSGRVIAGYEALRSTPSEERAKKIAQVLGVGVTDIFPPYLEEFRITQAPTIFDNQHLSLEEALASGGIPELALPGPEDDSELERDLQQKALLEVLETLPEREKNLIILRYGLEDGTEPLTLEGVAHKMGLVSRERARQIEAQALKKLRHSSNARRLRDWAR
jgi:RNA polymerase sigma factor (sigma-70 family)